MLKKWLCLTALLTIPAILVLFLAAESQAQCVEDADEDNYFREPIAVCALGGDCNDGDPNIHPEAVEVCNGYDDDCDGGIDNHPSCITACINPQDGGPQSAVADFTSSRSINPSFVWTKMVYGLVWVELPSQPADPSWTLYFTQFDEAGVEQQAGPTLIDVDDSDSADVVWTGQEYGVAWERSVSGVPEDVYFQRVNVSGGKERTPTQVTATGQISYVPQASWSGRNYGVAWQDYRNGSPLYFPEAYGVALERTGQKIGSEKRLSSHSTFFDGTGERPDIAWSGGEFGVVWSDRRDGNAEIYFTRMSEDGVQIGGEIRLTSDSADSGTPRIIWSGEPGLERYGVVWQNRRDGDSEVFFAAIDRNGAKLTSDKQLSSAPFSGSPDIAWSGSEFGVVWGEARAIYFARVDSLGNKLGPDLLLNPDFSRGPRVVWTGSSFGVVWSDARGGPQDEAIYFTRVTCGGNCSVADPDNDFDGICSSADCDDGDDTRWGRPSEAQNLRFRADSETLEWDQPDELGADPFDVTYDTLRSNDPADFVGAGTCLPGVESVSRIVLDAELPTAGGAPFFYLVRAKNSCPGGQGEGPLGVQSGGADRQGPNCP